MKLPSIFAFAFLALSAPIPSLVNEPAAAEARSSSGTCGLDSYINSRGHCVHRPVRANSAPAGASARCRDGTYSFSESRRGTCSHHGGVAEWL
jgi:hypothetical protein